MTDINTRIAEIVNGKLSEEKQIEALVAMFPEAKDGEGEHLFQVTWTRDDEGKISVSIDMGLQANEDLPTDEMKMYALSRMMNSLALRLAESTIGDEVED